MEIFLVRHGETLWNTQGRLQGQVNEIELTEKGIQQAKEVAKKLEKIDFNVIFSSPFNRTIETTNIINKLKKNKIILAEELKERGYGELEGKCDKDGQYNIEELWDINNIYNFYEVEPVDLFIKRIHKFLDNIINENKYKRILLVSHSGVSIAMKIYFQGIPSDKNLLKLGINNCEVIRYEI